VVRILTYAYVRYHKEAYELKLSLSWKSRKLRWSRRSHAWVTFGGAPLPTSMAALSSTGRTAGRLSAQDFHRRVRTWFIQTFGQR
jgi:hypothetical protein